MKTRPDKMWTSFRLNFCTHQFLALNLFRILRMVKEDNIPGQPGVFASKLPEAWPLYFRADFKVFESHDEVSTHLWANAQNGCLKFWSSVPDSFELVSFPVKS